MLEYHELIARVRRRFRYLIASSLVAIDCTALDKAASTKVSHGSGYGNRPWRSNTAETTIRANRGWRRRALQEVRNYG
jgi:hypothetical protein